jgi:small basic protein (TIGR04137 family)
MLASTFSGSRAGPGRRWLTAKASLAGKLVAETGKIIVWQAPAPLLETPPVLQGRNRVQPLNWNIMSQHRSLRAASVLGGKRSVLKRFERVEVLKKRGQWKDGDRVTGLRKTKPDA